MNGRVAKRIRREERESGVIKRKQLFKPLTVPVKNGKQDKDGNDIYIETYIPRRQRRALMRRFATDLRKGRIDPMKVLEGLNGGQ